MVLLAMRVLCSILVCLAAGVSSNILTQHGRHRAGLNPSTGRVSITKAEVVPISLGSSSPVGNLIPHGSVKHQTHRRPHSRVPSAQEQVASKANVIFPQINNSPIPGAVPNRPSLTQNLILSLLNKRVNSPSLNASPIQDHLPAITFYSSGLNDPSAQANQNLPVSVFAHLHHAAGTEPSHVSQSSIQGSNQHNSPQPVLGHIKTSHLKKSHKKVRPNNFKSSTSGIPNGHGQNVPLNFPTPSSFPVGGRSVNVKGSPFTAFVNVKGSPFTAFVSLAPSSQNSSGGVPVALFRDSPTTFGLSVNDFLPPGFIR